MSGSHVDVDQEKLHGPHKTHTKKIHSAIDEQAKKDGVMNHLQGGGGARASTTGILRLALLCPPFTLLSRISRLARVADAAAAPAHSPGLWHKVRERRAQVVNRLNPGVLKGLGGGQPDGPWSVVGGRWSIVRVRFHVRVDVRFHVRFSVHPLQGLGEAQRGDRSTHAKQKNKNHKKRPKTVKSVHGTKKSSTTINHS